MGCHTIPALDVLFLLFCCWPRGTRPRLHCLCVCSVRALALPAARGSRARDSAAHSPVRRSPLRGQRTLLSLTGWSPRGASARDGGLRRRPLAAFGLLVLWPGEMPRPAPRAHPAIPPQAVAGAMAKGAGKTKTIKRTEDVVTREYTIHLRKLLHQIGFKKRAPRAVKEVKAFAKKMMGTADVRLDTKLNKFLWSQGVKGVPGRVRVRLARKRNDDEEVRSPAKFPCCPARRDRPPPCTGRPAFRPWFEPQRRVLRDSASPASRSPLLTVAICLPHRQRTSCTRCACTSRLTGTHTRASRPPTLTSRHGALSERRRGYMPRRSGVASAPRTNTECLLSSIAPTRAAWSQEEDRCANRLMAAVLAVRVSRHFDVVGAWCRLRDLACVRMCGGGMPVAHARSCSVCMLRRMPGGRCHGTIIYR